MKEGGSTMHAGATWSALPRSLLSGCHGTTPQRPGSEGGLCEESLEKGLPWPSPEASVVRVSSFRRRMLLSGAVGAGRGPGRRLRGQGVYKSKRSSGEKLR